MSAYLDTSAMMKFLMEQPESGALTIFPSRREALVALRAGAEVTITYDGELATAAASSSRAVLIRPDVLVTR